MEFKYIKDFEDYMISDTGIVISLKDKTYISDNNEIKGRILSTSNNGKGYRIINLYKNGKKYPKKIHRLVAEAFIENTYNKEQVNHIDGNKSNNNVSNLEWVTNKENCRHREDNGLGNIKAATIAKFKPIEKYDLKTGKTIKKFNSVKEASKEFNCRIDSIASVARGCKKSYKGFGYRYIKNEI